MQHTSYCDEDDYEYVAHLDVKDVKVVMDPSLMTCAHDYSCPVCRKNHAVLSLGEGLMKPCWTCAEDWKLVRIDKRNWFQKLIGLPA